MNSIKRLATDGAAVRIEELAELLGTSVHALIRWAVKGKRGVRLDAIRSGDSWFSSWAAITRFRQATGKGERRAELLERVRTAITSASEANRPRPR